LSAAIGQCHDSVFPFDTSGDGVQYPELDDFADEQFTEEFPRLEGERLQTIGEIDCQLASNLQVNANKTGRKGGGE
jgi:hypothetical protein